MKVDPASWFVRIHPSGSSRSLWEFGVGSWKLIPSLPKTTRPESGETPSSTTPGTHVRTRPMHGVLDLLDLCTGQSQDVDCVHLSPSPRRERPGLHDQRRVTSDPIAGRGVSNVTDVEMAGEEHVGAGIGELPHGHVGAANQMLVAMRLGQIRRG